MSRILRNTGSVCPVCLKRITAAYIVCGDDVFMEKSCPDHGDFSSLVWQGAEGFKAWNHENPHQPPKNPATGTDRGCPYDCGICAAHKQATCCVLFEVTERCNLSCPTCFASSGEGQGRDVPIAEIGQWYDMLLRHGGPHNIQLSGGEPTLRDDLPEIIAMGKAKGFTFFQLNTNGVRIAEDMAYLQSLADAGLNTVFLQFDGLSGKSCTELRGRDLTALKVKAVENCGNAGLGVVLVPTVKMGCNDGETGDILDFAAEHMPVVRGVHFQPMSYFGRYDGQPGEQEHITIPYMLQAMEQQTGGRLKADDFLPGGAEHPLCSFHADYTVTDGEWELQVSTGNSGCCGGDADEGSCCGESTTSDAARTSVARKWSAPTCCPEEPELPGYDLSALDEFLDKKWNRTLAISGMCFQDAWNLDLDRLSCCYINIVDPVRQRLIPFCSYNLTATDGHGLYRGQHG